MGVRRFGGGWVGSNPQVDGYSGIVDLPPGAEGHGGRVRDHGPGGRHRRRHMARAIYGAVADVVTPGDKLPFAATPRGDSGNG